MCALIHPGSAQVVGEFLEMNFESGATLVLDSVYPAGCWQVGRPAKTLFTTALSLPNALVTDTLLPYPSFTTCYAEFTLLADESSNDYGRWFEFDHWLDLAPGSRAYIEARDTWSSDWSRLNDGWYAEGSVINGPQGYEFAGSTGAWEHVAFDSPCGGVMQATADRWYDPLMRLRFVLEAGDNGSGRDGWMIDDFRATATICAGGLTEHRVSGLKIYPNPANDRVLIQFHGNPGPSTVQVIRSDGAIVAVTTVQGDRIGLSVDELPSGPYLIRSIGSMPKQAMLLIQR